MSPRQNPARTVHIPHPDRVAHGRSMRSPRLKPVTAAVVVLLLAGGAHAQRALGPAWMAQKNLAQSTAAATGRLPNGQLASTLTNPMAQQQQAQAQLQRSIGNLNLAARGIAAQQAAQAAARLAAANGASVPDGLTEGGLKIDTNALTAGWHNANAPEPSQVDGRTNIAIQQTADKAILNWETFNVGKNTTVDFRQQADWAVLNRVNDSNARPSQIQGRIKGDGTVLVVNRNGIVFNGTSQVNTRNLVAAAAEIDDGQFKTSGIYSANAAQPSFTNAQGKVEIQAGARIATLAPKTSTEGGGYVLLLGSEVHNAGDIATPKGQTALAAGDSFAIRKGVGTDGNQASTTRGNEITPQFSADSLSGKVTNTGLIVAREGDVTMVGRDVRQNGVALATTTVNTRGTVHLNAIGDTGRVVLAPGAVSAVVLESDAGSTALDSQRDGLRIPVSIDGQDTVVVTDSRDQSRIEVTSGGSVDFQGDSLTLATGGQIVVEAAGRSLVRNGAQLDVSGAVGVNLSMETNNLQVNIQGNEQRDAPGNRDSKLLNSNDVWIDRRSLVFVAKGTNGYKSDRWYTAGGLLEVGGYLGTQGHTVGEWMAQGGTLRFGGNDVVTQAGSNINLSGGTLNVQTGFIRQTWLKGSDGRLYEVNKAPGDQRYTGVYKGFEDEHVRWGKGATEYFYNPLIGPQKRLESGYTVGRDAGQLVIATSAAVLEGAIVSEAFQGPRQIQAAQADLDGYHQSHDTAARRGQLVVGQYFSYYDKRTGALEDSLAATLDQVTLSDMQTRIADGLDLTTALPEARQRTLVLDTAQLNGFALGAIRIAAKDRIVVDADLRVAAGGEITLYGNEVAVNAGLTARGGSISLGDVLDQMGPSGKADTHVNAAAPSGRVTLGQGVVLDASGLWSNLLLDPSRTLDLPYLDGGRISLRSAGDVTLGAGSVIDVSSGAALSAKGKLRGGKGGDLSLRASSFARDRALPSAGALTLDGALRGAGVSGGGTLTLQAGDLQVGGALATDAHAGTLLLDAGFFDKGFASYDLTANRQLTVADGAVVDVTMPVLELREGGRQVPGTAHPSEALARVAPALYQPSQDSGVMHQRRGASLTLNVGARVSSEVNVQDALLQVGEGAVLSVDPGQSITLASIGQLTVDGRLNAWGGDITLRQLLTEDIAAENASGPGHNRSIRLGRHALLDASARAVTALDVNGLRYGLVGDGGRIVVGGEIDAASSITSGADQFVLIERGARLEASGAQAVLDVRGGSAVDVAGDGGHIGIASVSGLYLEGDLVARAGGAGAAGGTLDIGLDRALYASRLTVPERVRAQREMIVTRERLAEGAPGTLAALAGGDLAYGNARISADAIHAGGFDAVSLLAPTLSFGESVTLTAGRSLSLYAGVIGLANGADPASQITIAAPYVRLAAPMRQSTDRYVTDRAPWTSPSARETQAVFTAEANLIDVRDGVRFGAGYPATESEDVYNVDRRGFATVALDSTGDIRLLAPTLPAGDGITSLTTANQLDLLASQIYPTTGARTVLIGGQIDVARTSAVDPAVPYSAFGSLTLESDVVHQGGVLRAPLGTITLGPNSNSGGQVELLPGSLTSVSAAGLVMPYGGTVDGVVFRHGGQAIDKLFTNQAGLGLVTLKAESVQVREGAVVDLTGGGDLKGAGFVSGRGGSTDARFHPLTQVAAEGGFTLPSLATNPVYAIVPGVQAAQAPVGEGASDPAVGRQITVRNGVAGLPAGTYTLMPSSYALLPGAFRVEIGGGAVGDASARALAMRNGSFSVGAHLSTAGTGVRDTLASQVILTPADVLRTYSQYNEMGVSAFAQADAARLGVPAVLQSRDGKRLLVDLNGPEADHDRIEQPFSFDGLLRSDGAAGGARGITRVLSLSGIEIVADGQSRTPGYVGATVRDADLNAIGAGGLSIGGGASAVYGQGGNILTFNAAATNVNLRGGASLVAPSVFLVATNGGITVEQGASIITLGQGAATQDSANGYVFAPVDAGVLAVSNGRLDMLANDPYTAASSGMPSSIRIGVCDVVCGGVTRLYSEGSIAVATYSAFELTDAVRYGTRHLSLAVGGINAGSAQTLGAMAAEGKLPAGLTLNQELLDSLLRGDTALGAPALETLSLAASEGMRFYGDVTLDTYDANGVSRLQDLVLTTPALYGAGTAGNTVTLRTASLVWNGSPTAAAPMVTGGAGDGDGVLNVEAERITLGYVARAQVKPLDAHDRLVLGFGTVNLNASDRFSANHTGSLAVHHRQGAYVTGKGYDYSGGDLNLHTPLLTGTANSVMRISAGGMLRATTGAPASPQALAARSADALGAELSLAARDLVVDTAVLLPSGKLSLSAERDLTLGGASHLDLAGRAVAFNDVTRYSWGGDVKLASLHGNVNQAAGSVVDVSAQHNQAGTLEAIALDAAAGTVSLQGRILGGSSGRYDAGGTLVPYRAGGIDIRAQNLGGALDGEFAALNQRLNDGGVFGERSFQLKQGDLTIGDGLKAGEVNVSVDNGSLTVAGTVDASGERVGSIRLAGKNGLTLGGNALLDAHGSVLRVDSYGKIIDSPNRAIVELDGGEGTLTLAGGARIDLRHGTGAVAGNKAGQHDGRRRGTLELTAGRTGEISGDIRIDASGSLSIEGARSIAVNAVWRYDDTDADAVIKDGLDAVSGRPYREITQAYLDKKDLQSVKFIDAALANGALLDGKLAGLNNAAYADALHLRPGVEIVTDKDLVVQGDLDLSGYRYASLKNSRNPQTGVYGSGEVGRLTLRAAGDLSVYGSINDGFAPPPVTQDDTGWLLVEGVQPFGGDVVVPGANVVLQEGTAFERGKVLNYDLPMQAMTMVGGTVLPAVATLAGDLRLAAGTVLSGDILDADGSRLHAAGTILAQDLVLQAGMKLGAGTRLAGNTALGAMTWPAGVPLPSGPKLNQQAVPTVQLAGSLSLKSGSLIPSMTDVKLGGAESIALRPADADGNQGRNWALAQMLPEGSQSWSLQLVAGADLGAADRRLTDPHAAHGTLRLADTHYGMNAVPAGGLVWSETGAENMGAVAGEPIDFENGPAAGWATMCEDMPEFCAAPSGGALAYERGATRTSVVRTGTGDLALAAAGDVRTDSLYGVYTAGTATAADSAYEQPRGQDADGKVLSDKVGGYEALVSGADSLYKAWYPDQGGNLTLSAGGRLMGDLVATYNSNVAKNDMTQAPSSAVGNWLWRQGTGDALSAGNSLPTAWWINFGTLATVILPRASTALVGFTGFGTLGGGNVDVRVGQDAGAIEHRGDTSTTSGARLHPRSQSLVFAVGSTGRVGADGSLQLTGGGDLSLRVGGGINPTLAARNMLDDRGRVSAPVHELQGTIVNLRGATQVQAGALGGIDLLFSRNPNQNDATETRAFDVYQATKGVATGGLTLVPGDSAMTLNMRGDLVLGAAVDAGRAPQFNTQAFTLDNGTAYLGGGRSWFSLWTPHTAINLFSAGGNLTPGTQSAETQNASSDAILAGRDASPTDGRYVYPSILRVTAAQGSIYYGASALSDEGGSRSQVRFGIVLAPSASGELSFLAGDSMYGGGYAISASSAPASALATPLNPGFVGHENGYVERVSNQGDARIKGIDGRFPLFAFGADTASGNSSGTPARFYALSGDIVGLRNGEQLSLDKGEGTWYVGAGPVRVMAGRDIVASGTRPGEPTLSATELNAASSGNLFVHDAPTDVSVVSAGRDIVYSSFNVAGPGTLEINAGRNIRMEDRASVASIGAVAPNDTRPGADIVMVAGAGSAGPDYQGFLKRYLDAANLLPAGTALADRPGSAVKVYGDAQNLVPWLRQTQGYTGSDADAQAFFQALAPEQQSIYARHVYYAELRAGGREYNDVDGVRYGSYLRGRNAIAALFPSADADGQARSYAGNITMYGPAGVNTLFGGNIQLFTPGGAQTFGTEGEAPVAKGNVTPGVITQGAGDIHIYSLGSILLGQSRIMTTFGGGILGWSAEGDINAGRGSKTTVVYTPPKRVYDQWGNVTLSSDVPSTGAGIATLAPIPEVPAGDIDLIAPLGTIDAGEAGIRVSGNVNLAALQVVNAANIAVKGEAIGIPTVAAVNVGALSNASAAASQAAGAAQEVLQRERVAARQSLPSVFTVRVLGFGNEPVDGGGERSSGAPAAAPVGYRPDSAVQVLGQAGRVDEGARNQLTPAERRTLGL
ncbi:filamentous haemagglutinin family protein [Variovorax sp. LT1R16]|uniref:filamentous haemagglutinin family protein n=1 Tax=Variovorax sp. LT1R16 TaxID=3443728 RepID=UPI003F4795C3